MVGCMQKDVRKTLTPKTQTSDPQNSDPLIFFLKIYIFLKKKKVYIGNSSRFLLSNVLWSRNVNRQPPERSDIFIFFGLSLSRRSNTERLRRLKIVVDTLMTFAGKFSTEVAILMLFKFKSVLYPPDETVINQGR